MKKIALLKFIVLFSLYFVGCNLFNGGKKNIKTYYSSEIKQLIIKAINGNKEANLKLSNLIDLKIPLNSNYNLLQIDSVKIKDGKKRFLVLLEYSNPFYNRFAIYDSILTPFLIDKSLNGYITIDTSMINDGNIIQVNEDFTSKDTLQLTRTSFYLFTDSSANLAFRTFTKLIMPTNVFTQTISKVSPERIKTNLSSQNQSEINGMLDIFTFDPFQKKYISPNPVFDYFVKRQVITFKHDIEKPEITDIKSAFASVGIDYGLDTIRTTSNTKDTQGFSLTLTENWHTLKNFTMDDLFNQKLIGTRYINEVLGASISVVKINPKDSAEMFINYKLLNNSSGKYKVSYSDKILLKKDFLQFFEFTCGTKKFILVLKASKYTYEQYKKIYSSIIDSFTIDC
jgi:hypothetical protein